MRTGIRYPAAAATPPTIHEMSAPPRAFSASPRLQRLGDLRDIVPLRVGERQSHIHGGFSCRDGLALVVRDRGWTRSRGERILVAIGFAASARRSS